MTLFDQHIASFNLSKDHPMLIIQAKTFDSLAAQIINAIHYAYGDRLLVLNRVQREALLIRLEREIKSMRRNKHAH